MVTENQNELQDEPRVVVTGIGILSPLGKSLGEIWQALENNVSGLGPITRFDAGTLKSRVAGEISESNQVDTRFKPEYYDQLNRPQRYSVSAALSAVQSAGLVITPENSGQVACVITSNTPFTESESQLAEESNIHSAHSVAALMGVSGPVIPLNSDHLSGIEAIVEATELIKRKRAFVAIAGATDARIDRRNFEINESMGLLSTKYNDNPESASRPLEHDRDGFIMAEGSVVFVLEALEVAVTRGAKILAEIEGSALTFSPGKEGSPDTDPIYIGRAIQGALIASGRIQSEVDAVMLDANGSLLDDAHEARAIHRVFGSAARHHMYTPALKSHFGDLGAASGPLSMAITLEAMNKQMIPSTRNLETEDEDIDLDANPNGIRSDALRVVMINSIHRSQNATIAICDPTAMRQIPENFNIPDEATIPELDI